MFIMANPYRTEKFLNNYADIFTHDCLSVCADSSSSQTAVGIFMKLSGIDWAPCCKSSRKFCSDQVALSVVLSMSMVW